MTRRGERIALAAVLLLAAALRLPSLDVIPNGLIPDEALSGYDAFSIAKTGRDAYGERLPLFPRSTARLHSLYIYLAVPFVAAHGLDELSVRLPSALAGIATVGLLFAWLRDAFGATAGLLGALLLAVSPWHVLLSRTGYDWNLLPAMAALTAWLLTRALVHRAALWPGALAAGVSLYTYAPVRIFLPLLLLAIGLTHWRELRDQRRRAMPALLIAAALAAPVAAMTLRAEGRQRLASITADDGGSAAGFSARFLRSFSPDFLLGRADAAELHRLRSTGLLQDFEAPLILAGIVACAARRERRALLPLLACAVAPLAVAIHRDAPDPILAVVMLPWLQALGGIGGAFLMSRAAVLHAPARLALMAGFAAWASVSVVRMGLDLYRLFPVYAAPAWGYGTREAVGLLEARRSGEDTVHVDTGEKLIGSLILFYTRLDPRARHAEIAGLEGRSERSRAGAYRIGPIEEAAAATGRRLVWTTPERATRLPTGARLLTRVALPDGRERYALLLLASDASR